MIASNNKLRDRTCFIASLLDCQHILVHSGGLPSDSDLEAGSPGRRIRPLPDRACALQPVPSREVDIYMGTFRLRVMPMRHGQLLEWRCKVSTLDVDILLRSL